MCIWTAQPDSTPLASAYASYFMLYLSLGTAPLIMSWLSDLYVFSSHCPVWFMLTKPFQVTPRSRSSHFDRRLLYCRNLCSAFVVAGHDLASIAGTIL